MPTEAACSLGVPCCVLSSLYTANQTFRRYSGLLHTAFFLRILLPNNTNITKTSNLFVTSPKLPECCLVLPWALSESNYDHAGFCSVISNYLTYLSALWVHVCLLCSVHKTCGMNLATTDAGCSPGTHHNMPGELQATIQLYHHTLGCLPVCPSFVVFWDERKKCSPQNKIRRHSGRAWQVMDKDA